MATDDSVQQNDSVNMNSNLQVENSNKVTNVVSTGDNVEVKNDEQHENTKETQPSPEKRATLNDTDLNNTTSKVFFSSYYCHCCLQFYSRMFSTNVHSIQVPGATQDRGLLCRFVLAEERTIELE